MGIQAVTTTVPDTNLGSGKDRTLLAVSAAMANADTSAPVPLLGFDEVGVTVTGTFGAGGSVAIEGSFDGTNFFALPNVAGTTVAITAAGYAYVLAATRFIRARVTAGDGTTALVMSIFLRTKSRS